jgi:hypothetical protein
LTQRVHFHGTDPVNLAYILKLNEWMHGLPPP